MLSNVKRIAVLQLTIALVGKEKKEKNENESIEGNKFT